MGIIIPLIRSATCIILCAGLLSCGKTEESPITFKVRNSQAVLVPTAAQSCRDQNASTATVSTSVASKHFSFYFPEIEISKTKMDKAATINIVGLTIKIQSAMVNGGQFKCIIAGDELKYLYYDPSTGAVWDPTNITYDATANGSDGTAGTFKSTYYWVTGQGYRSCPLRCGGISTKDIEFTAPVTFELLAVSSVKKEDGTQVDTPYKISTSGLVKNLF